MSSHPAIELAAGSLSFREWSGPLVVDPDVELVADLLDAWADAVPTIADPSPETLREDDVTDVDPPADVPMLHVLARREVYEDVFDEFHPSSRAAGLVEVGLLRLSVLEDPQPNVAVSDPDRGLLVVETGAGRETLQADRSLDDRYRPLAADTPQYRLRLPSRRRLYEAFAERCGDAVATDLLRLFDASPGIGTDSELDQWTLPYLVGARHGVLHYSLRKAGVDAGFGSPATFSNVKCWLVETDLVTTESVPQSVGRPRQRLVATDDRLVETPPSELRAVVREALGRERREGEAERADDDTG